MTIIYLKNWDQIAVGTKNGVLKIFCVNTMNQIEKSIIFKVCICSLADIDGKYIGIGGDYGDSSVILWDRFNKNDQIAARYSNHTAAVTSIIDLMDSEHFISTSLDSTIVLYGHCHKRTIDQINTQ